MLLLRLIVELMKPVAPRKRSPVLMIIALIILMMISAHYASALTAR